MADPVIIQFSERTVKQFEMLECEVKFDDNYFHHQSQVTVLNYHNAYDADEDFTLFRADAVFLHEGKEHVVPVFAVKDEVGTWKWLVRFRPHRIGTWIFRLRVLCWHPKPVTGEPPDARRVSPTGRTYFEHEFGYNLDDFAKCPEAEKRFTVSAANLPGPLEMPGEKENRNYFYRWLYDGRSYQRRSFFVLGTARAWVVKNLSSGWDGYLDRDTELFRPMHAKGCNVLYHWMSPWESQLVHQSQDEYWPRPDGTFTGAYPSNKLAGRNAHLGYKRLDQGRALQTDRVFNLAQKHQILIFLSVMSHQSLQEPPHLWGEHGWGKLTRDDPSKLNGFQLFQPTLGNTLSIRQFFEMDPEGKAAAWTRRLWKHFANFWRYIIGRWTAHPAMGAWVLIDELEGVGTGPSWWWDNRRITYAWHDHLVQLIRGKLRWKWAGKDIPYTGDYLHHPVTTSTTHYEGTVPPSSRSLSSEKALQMVNSFCELPDHGTWGGNHEKTDFVTHHAYQSVPTWGESEGPASARRYRSTGFTGWYLPNESGTKYVAPNRWLWDTLCMRLYNWGKANSKTIRLVTEFGCLERDRHSDKWDHYGKRFPSYSHFANWASLVLGHAGIPFKWNDGASLGEMAARTSAGRVSPVWKVSKYPPDNYAETTNIVGFLRGLLLDDLYPEKLEVVNEDDNPVPYMGSDGKAIMDDKNKAPIARFNAWALANCTRTTVLAWIYDRTFSTNGESFSENGKAIECWLKINGAIANQRYNCAWFDTWSGSFISSSHATVNSDAKGVLKISLPRLPKSSKDTIKGVADGNDIAIRLTAAI